MEAENYLPDPRIRPFLRRKILATTGAWTCVQDSDSVMLTEININLFKTIGIRILNKIYFW